MGRTPLPDNVKQLRGTLQPSRVNKAQPTPPALEVGAKPPEWLKGPRRADAWRGLVELLGDHRVLTVMDTAALAMLVDAFGDYLEASDVIAGRACGRCGLALNVKSSCTSEEGHSAGRRYYTTRTKEGSLMIRPHPAMTERKDAWDRVLKMLDRFGMSPSMRTKVSAAGESDVDPFEAYLQRGTA